MTDPYSSPQGERREPAPGPADAATDGSTARPDAGAASAGTASADGREEKLPGITLPKGGGAVRSIDEKLTVGLATGTASLSVPLPLPPGRQGFGPDLSLEYASGSGNGPFGLGWRVGAASVTRKTSLGLPRYEDADESDVYVLSEAEDLVPLLVPLPGGGFEPDVGPDPTSAYTVRRYRPRVEGGFARVERWQHDTTGDVHWRTVSRDNVTRLFGQDAGSRIVDPDDPGRIFSWLVDLSYDDRGNAITYTYKAEDTTGAPAAVHEQRRTVTANRYLKSIRYGNTSPYLPATDPALPDGWYFEVVFDYGEHDAADPTPAEAHTWPCRPDPFSSYRSCFEVRTYRLCRRVLVFHRFPDGQDPSATIVRSLDLGYGTDSSGDPSLPVYSLLETVTERGYIASGGAPPAAKSWPPLTLEYTKLAVHDAVETAGPGTLANLPAGADGRRWRLVDLDGEGLQGILTEDDNAWYYKRNISAFEPGGGPLSARFEPLSLVATKPARGGGAGTPQLVDLHADGRLCAVDFAPPFAGFSERASDGTWSPFKPLATTAALDWSSSNVRTLDLDGDGLADVLLTEDDAFTWYPWVTGDGFGPSRRVATTRDEDRGPALVLDQGDSSIFLADMSGDGLTDLVRIRNGEVCYWPNVGFGRFGAKIVMDDPPRFDTAGTFDPKRVKMADIDGSGTADVVYVGTGAVTLFFNESGNRFTAGTTLAAFPKADDQSTVAALDLLGSGTSCLVWSSPLPGDGGRQLRYVQLTGGVKPHLLSGVVNNMGSETTLTYAPSTTFYVEDLLAGKPWATRLAFPVHVVAQKVVTDRVSRTRLVSSYTYHHGYFDSTEREFRGFARVDQTDTDYVPAASGTGTFTALPAASGDEFALPPVLVRTWTDTGAYLDGAAIATVLSNEYFTGDPHALHPGPTRFVGAVTPEELRESCRALRGRALRTETYALDGTPDAGVPYQTEEHRYQVHLLQPPLGTSYASVYACDLETVTYHYERDVTDPRVGHDMTLEVDPYGAVTKSASAAYPRPGAALPEQSATLVTYAEHDVANVVTENDWYRVGLPIETRQYEVSGITPAAGALLDVDSFLATVLGATTIPFEQQPSGAAPQKRLFARSRTVYRSNDLSGPLPTPTVESLALVDRSYKLALTAGLLSATYTTAAMSGAVAAAVTAAGGYVDLDGDGDLWVPSARAFYSPAVMNAGVPFPPAPDPVYATAHFYLRQGEVDPFGGARSITWEHDIAVVGAVDPVGNTTAAVVNYRLLQPWLVTDANQNRSGVRCDALGVVVASAVMGKALPGGADEGDHLDLSTDEASASDEPTSTFDYDVSAYGAWASDPSADPDHPQPVSVHTRARVTHKDPSTAWVETYRYLDGTGRAVLSKAQAEPGTAPERDAGGHLVRDAGGHLQFADTSGRWVGTGQVVRDNKGNPVKSYEPFFDSSPVYTDETDLVQWGVTSVTRYDPLSRAVRVDKPDGSYTSTDIGTWRRLEHDEDDNVLDSEWYTTNDAPSASSDQRDAAGKAAALAGTPLVSDLDPLGRVFHTVADGVGGQFRTRKTLDIAGRLLATQDALGRTVLTTAYSLNGSELGTQSIDAGQKWLLPDASGNPLLAWDSRGFQIRHTYDPAHRPLGIYVTPSAGTEALAEEVVYGEGLSNAVDANLRNSVHQQHDGAGSSTTLVKDFKGNVLQASRQVLTDYVHDVDWSGSPGLEPALGKASTYDALNRVVTTTTPDGTVTTPTYNVRNLLAAASVDLRGGGTTTPVVTAAGYDAKGQRQSITYGNGVTTSYSYDPETFRLTNLTTLRPGDPGPLQDLTYVYDPVGNITRVTDGAAETIFYANQVVSPGADYTYDAVYRLVKAAGREHVSQSGPVPPSWDGSSLVPVPLPADGQAMANYTETYTYDLVGNFASLAHSASGGGWTRSYTYADPANNQLTSTTVGATTEPYTYDPDGNMQSMPQLTLLQWDWKNRTRATASQLVHTGTPETTYYRYDAAGVRVLKVTDTMQGSRAAERVYFGPYERYREYDGQGTVTLEIESMHVPDGDRRICLFETTTVDAGAPGVATPATTTRYQLADRLESAVIELDGTAAIISYEEYYPYGGTSFRSGAGAVEVSLKRYRYIGKELDGESGLYSLGLRYYAPWLGRWTSPDPAGLVDGVNRYAYAKGNPVAKSDRKGTQGDDPKPAPQPQPLKEPEPEPPARKFGPIDITGLDIYGLSQRDPTRIGRQIFVGASVPQLGLTGTGVVSADPVQAPDIGGAYPIDARGSFNLSGGPGGLLRLQLDATMTGITGAPPVIPNVTAPPFLAGDITVFGKATALGLPLAQFKLSSSAEEFGKGSLALSGSALFGLGKFSGTGSFDAEGWTMQGKASVIAPPLAVAFGSWSIGSAQPLTASIHYFGVQVGPLQLVPDLDPFARLRPPNYAASPGDTPDPSALNQATTPPVGPVAAGVTASPGPSIGYNYIQVSGSNYSIFSIGVGLGGNNYYFNAYAYNSTLYPIPVLDSALFGHDMSTPLGQYGLYGGVNYTHTLPLP